MASHGGREAAGRFTALGGSMVRFRGGGDAQCARIRDEVAEAPSAMAGERGHGRETGGTGALVGQ